MLRSLQRTAPAVLRRRLFASTATSRAEPQPGADTAQTQGAKNIFNTHTVEDLHGMHATEILAETGTRADAKMRHFTGT